jgi:hypothetical protein
MWYDILYRMKAYCKYCDTQAQIRNNTIGMKCMCDEEHRFMSIDKIKDGYYVNQVYLLDDDTQCYDQKKSLCGAFGRNG